MFLEDGTVYVEDEDQCSTCKFATSRRKLCPLVEAMGNGWAVLTEDITVENCGLYEEKYRVLS